MKNTNDSFFNPNRLVFLEGGALDKSGGAEQMPADNPKPVEGPQKPEDIAKGAQQGAEKLTKEGEAVIGDVETQEAYAERGEFKNTSGKEVTAPVVRGTTTAILAHLNSEGGKPDLMAVNAGGPLQINVPVKGYGMHSFDVKKNPATGKVDMTLTQVA